MELVKSILDIYIDFFEDSFGIKNACRYGVFHTLTLPRLLEIYILRYQIPFNSILFLSVKSNAT